MFPVRGVRPSTSDDSLYHNLDESSDITDDLFQVPPTPVAIGLGYRLSSAVGSFIARIWHGINTAWDWILINRFVIACSVYVIMDIMITVYYKRLMDHTKNYVLFTLESLVAFFACLFCIIYLICLFLIPSYMERTLNIKALFILGFLDVVSNSLSSIGSTNTSGVMLVILGQLGIPLTIISCKLILTKKYHNFQYIGSALIVLFVMIKESTQDSSSKDNVFKYNLIYMAASIPDSIAAAIRSIQYTSTGFNLVKFQFFSVLTQLLMGIPMIIIATYTRTLDPNYFTNLSKLIVNGANCLFRGINSVVEECGADGKLPCDNCSDAFWILCTFVMFNIIMRVAYIVIMLKGSVTLTFLLGTIKIPLSSIAFSFTFISGSSTSTIDYMDIMCFVGIMASLGLYSYGSNILHSENDTNGDTQAPLLENNLSDEL